MVVLKNLNVQRNKQTNKQKTTTTTKTDEKIQKLVEVLEKSEHKNREVISPIFLVQKCYGSDRMILNLKQFNEGVEYEHFKIENLHSATNLTSKKCYMAS